MKQLCWRLFGKLFLKSVSFLPKLFHINRMLPLSPKYCNSIIIFGESEFDYKTKFDQFMYLFDKTVPEKRTIGQCKATNDIKLFFYFLF